MTPASWLWVRPDTSGSPMVRTMSFPKRLRQPPRNEAEAFGLQSTSIRLGMGAFTERQIQPTKAKRCGASYTFDEYFFSSSELRRKTGLIRKKVKTPPEMIGPR